MIKIFKFNGHILLFYFILLEVSIASATLAQENQSVEKLISLVCHGIKKSYTMDVKTGFIYFQDSNSIATNKTYIFSKAVDEVEFEVGNYENQKMSEKTISQKIERWRVNDNGEVMIQKNQHYRPLYDSNYIYSSITIKIDDVKISYGKDQKFKEDELSVDSTIDRYSGAWEERYSDRKFQIKDGKKVYFGGLLSESGYITNGKCEKVIERKF